MKKIVITGAASGMGASLVKRYHQVGYEIYASKLAIQEAPIKDAHIHWFDIDFLIDDLKLWIEQLPKDIDIFIANAGQGAYEINTPPLEMDPLYQLNTLTPMHQFEILKKRNFKGTFVVMGSIMALWPLPGYARYSHTKGALVTYFKALQTTEDIPIVILMPVAVKTEFFMRSTQPHAPWLAQDADKIAIKFQKVIAKKKAFWISSALFKWSYRLVPWALRFYLKREAKLYHKKFIEGETHD